MLIKNAVLSDRRKKLGLTQEELASVVGVQPSAISHYENGIRIPRGEIAKKLSALLDIPLEDII